MQTQNHGLPRWVPLLAGALVIVALLACGVAAVLGTGAFWWLSHSRSNTTQRSANGGPAISSVESSASPQQARLQSTRGLVEIQAQGGGWTPVSSGALLAAGESLRTGELSSAELAFSDGSWVSLGPDTHLSIDELDAPAKGAARQVVLTQWVGESSHTVTPNTRSSSRYEVHTPSATGAARGTQFDVSVTPEKTARFNVSDGTVAVSAADVTVLVQAGEETSVQADEPPSDPVFHISGEGIVTQTGETWIIGGQEFTTHAGTVFLGSPQLGDLVHVEGRLLPDGARLADLIVLLRSSPANQFSLIGIVEAIEDGSWTVAGQSLTVDETSDVEAGIQQGDLVWVEGSVLEGGALHADRIRRLSPEGGLPFDFTGVVQTVGSGDSPWVISGVSLTVDENTLIDQDLDSGEVVRVRGRILPDGTWLAQSIQRAQGGTRSFELVGVLQSINPWVVAGINLDTRPWTTIQSGLAAGDLVRVKGQIQADGTWLAYSIEKFSQEPSAHMILIGTVISTNPWVVSGIPLTVDENTLIGPNITVGTLVRVEILLLPDGTWKVLSIESLQGISGVPGCMTFTAMVVSLNGDQLQLLGWPLLTLNEGVQIEGNLVANSIIQIQICIGENAQIQIISIVVIFQPEEQVEPPSAESGKVTVCHKPNKRGGHSITIARPALPAHLAHGDYVGTCSP